MAATNRAESSTRRRVPVTREATNGHQNSAELDAPGIAKGRGRATTEAAAKRGRAAGRTAVKRNSTNVHLPLLGHVTLPPPENLAWFGGMAALVAVEILEWPIAVVLGLGKVLSDKRHNKIIRDFGAALEEAG